jgi:hypothetical protein
MARLLTADDIMPLVASLSEQERTKLLHWIADPAARDAVAYAAMPPGRDEFSTEDDPLAWDADGWDEFL